MAIAGSLHMALLDCPAAQPLPAVPRPAAVSCAGRLARRGLAAPRVGVCFARKRGHRCCRRWRRGGDADLSCAATPVAVRGPAFTAVTISAVPVFAPAVRFESRRRALALLGIAPVLGAPTLLCAHGSRAGDVRVEHAYAPPTPAGATTAAVYFRALRNVGTVADRLLGATTPRARAVELHRSSLVDGVMRMRAQDALELPPGASLASRHGGEVHLMLVDLAQPLTLGDRFPLSLRFERAGSVEVSVWVQQPRAAGEAADAPAGHDHGAPHD